MLLNKLQFKRGSIPIWLISNVIYLHQHGSVMYGCSQDHSDMDIYGVCVPPKYYVYTDKILEYDQLDIFQQWQLHGFEQDKVKYDISIYGLPRYFKLLQDNNPNILDSIFAPQRCILFSSAIGQILRDNKHSFLSKACYWKMKAYAMSQLHKLDREPEGKRKAIVDQFGWDVKYGSHLVRLILQCEEILQDKTLTLDKHKETLKSIRRGEWTKDQVKQWFYDKERYVEDLYHKSDLRDKPDKSRIRNLLVDCLSRHYGEDKVEDKENRILETFEQVKTLINSI